MTAAESPARAGGAHLHGDPVIAADAVPARRCARSRSERLLVRCTRPPPLPIQSALLTRPGGFGIIYVSSMYAQLAVQLFF